MPTTIELKKMYDSDYFQWLESTIELLKNNQLDAIDYENLIEELEDLGSEKKQAVESLLQRVIIHLLMYQYWGAEYNYNARHWRAEIINFRNQLKRKMTTNLYHHLEQELLSIYADALDYVKEKTALNNLPQICPYTLEQLLDKSYL